MKSLRCDGCGWFTANNTVGDGFCQHSTRIGDNIVHNGWRCEHHSSLDRQRRIDETARAALTGMLAYSYVNPMTGNYHENSTPESCAVDAIAYAEAIEAEREGRMDNV